MEDRALGWSGGGRHGRLRTFFAILTVVAGISSTTSGKFLNGGVQPMGSGSPAVRRSWFHHAKTQKAPLSLQVRNKVHAQAGSGSSSMESAGSSATAEWVGNGVLREKAIPIPDTDIIIDVETPENAANPSQIRKINSDMLLFRARAERRKYQGSPNPAEREAAGLLSEKMFRRCIALDSKDGRAYVGLGNLLTTQRRYTEAADIYEQATRITSGTNPFIWTAWAALEAKQGNDGRARKLYEGAVVANAEHAAAWHGWGTLEMRLGNTRRAQDIFVKGIRHTKKKASPYLYLSLSLLLEQTGRIEEARKWFIMGSKTSTVQESEALWHAWAKMEANYGDENIVRTLFERALKANPRSRYTYASWGIWEKEQGNHEKARELFQEGSRLNPRDAAILQAWALLEYELSNVDEARDLLRNATRVDPKHIPAWQAWGVLEFTEDNLDRARDLFQQGVWAGPNSADVAKVFQAWAILEKKTQNYSLARTLFTCAVKADRKSEASWLAWAQMEEDLGLLGRAEELRNYNEVEKLRGIETFGGIVLNQDSVISPLLRGVQSWIKQFSD